MQLMKETKRNQTLTNYLETEVRFKTDFDNSSISFCIFLLGYGKCAEDTSRHTSTHVEHKPSQIKKLMVQPRFISDVDLEDEFNEVMATEVNMHKSTVHDGKPVHVGFAILQWSKVLFLE